MVYVILLLSLEACWLSEILLILVCSVYPLRKADAYHDSGFHLMECNIVRLEFEAYSKCDQLLKTCIAISDL